MIMLYRDDKPEATIILLLMSLFFISFIKSFELLFIVSVAIILHSIIKLKNFGFIRNIKPVLLFITLVALPIFLNYILGSEIKNLEFSFMLIIKVAISSILLGTIVDLHSSLYLVEGVLNIGFPPFLNTILALTFRYFHMVDENVKKNNRALVSRGILERKGLSSISIYGELIGGFFLESSDHSVKIYNAMKSRGFEGQSKGKLHWNRKNIIELVCIVLILTCILFWDWKVSYGN